MLDTKSLCNETGGDCEGYTAKPYKAQKKVKLLKPRWNHPDAGRSSSQYLREQVQQVNKCSRGKSKKRRGGKRRRAPRSEPHPVRHRNTAVRLFLWRRSRPGHALAVESPPVQLGGRSREEAKIRKAANQRLNLTKLTIVASIRTQAPTKWGQLTPLASCRYDGGTANSPSIQPEPGPSCRLNRKRKRPRRRKSRTQYSSINPEDADNHQVFKKIEDDEDLDYVPSPPVSRTIRAKAPGPPLSLTR
ncbi:hypothetical protein U1Q18_024594 [Sarracenia purpurea var. burkii]